MFDVKTIDSLISKEIDKKLLMDIMISQGLLSEIAKNQVGQIGSGFRNHDYIYFPIKYMNRISQKDWEERIKETNELEKGFFVLDYTSSSVYIILNDEKKDTILKQILPSKDGPNYKKGKRVKRSKFIVRDPRSESSTPFPSVSSSEEAGTNESATNYGDELDSIRRDLERARPSMSGSDRVSQFLSQQMEIENRIRSRRSAPESGGRDIII